MIGAARAVVVLALVMAACADAVPPTDTPAPVATTNPTTMALPSTTAGSPATTEPPPTVPPAQAPTTTTSVTTSVVTSTAPPLRALAYERIEAPGIRQPVAMLPAPGHERLHVVERRGVIRLFEPSTGLAEQPFADLREQVGSAGIEMGLLGLAFHPDYATNGRLFVYYTDRGEDSHLVELAATSDRTGVDPDVHEVLLSFEQPTNRHNAGHLEFGPDGLLWVSLGEGGAASVHAQDPTTLLSSILRIDVDARTGGRPYEIPRDNPFADGADGAPEVWAFGLRNPWRFTIDAHTRLLYIADVGHSKWEEIDIVSIDDHVGHNFGWLEMEGVECFRVRGCDPAEFTAPVLVYGHDEGCSISGGFVYRGSTIPELDGHYLYSDWCSGFLRSITYVDGTVGRFEWTPQTGVVGQVSAFGRDAAGELYVLTWSGEIHRIVAVR